MPWWPVSTLGRLGPSAHRVRCEPVPCAFEVPGLTGVTGALADLL